MQSLYDALAVVPADKNYPGRIFAEEFILTFILVYVIFTVAFEDAEKLKKDSLTIREISDRKGLTVYASTPQSKTGV
jgi:glycerol uptake facilitator-like aquaporin